MLIRDRDRSRHGRDPQGDRPRHLLPDAALRRVAGGIDPLRQQGSRTGARNDRALARLDRGDEAAEAAETEVTPLLTRFAAIDWSGAKGKRHKGIAVAI